MSALRRLRDLLRGLPVHDGYEKTIYDLLRRKSSAAMSAYCRQRGFSAAEERALLGLAGAAAAHGYGAFKRLLLEREAELARVLPFELRELPAVREEDAEACRRMRDAAVGRRVVLTGPADYTIGAAAGDWIEGFDWVARINFQWPLAEAHASDLGRRMDVLYHCCNGDYPVERLFVDGFERTQFVCMEHQAHSLRLKRRCRELGISCLYTTETIARITRVLRHPPSTGLTAIEHLLSLPIRELQLYGITHWQAPYYAGYAGDGARVARGRRRIWRHAPRAERSHLLSLVARDPRLRIDATARRLLSLT